LHQFEMFLKYGHGRATADCNLAIHAGRMTRDEAVKIVNEIDGTFPFDYLPMYLDYFRMSENEFWGVIENHANREILKETGQIERPWILKDNIK